MSERILELEILRYDSDADAPPAHRTYSVPCQEDGVVLDALNYVKDHLDRTLSYRWSCHMAVCGSCGMMINGEPMLACKAFIQDLPDKIRIEPLANFEIERDLVTDCTGFVKKLASVKPYLHPKEDRAIEEGAHAQSPAELRRFKQFTLCINCMLCYAACPQFAADPDFAGPGALALAHRYNLDSRDKGRAVRQDTVAANDGIWACSFVGACSEVCPHAVDPAAAIQQIKIASTMDYFKNMIGLGRDK
ncbi:MAG: succinate dehydrogenase/fumarate reductase iron-sulfur subunit [Rhodospirillales bacterium]|nr:succinate dehydrogenase/fumarate reductase iron-sulfur subunit [Rhodospirillales bacterium]